MMRHYILLDSDNHPHGGRLHRYPEGMVIDIEKTYIKDLYLFDTINDSLLDYNPSKHRIFEAKIGSCTLPGGNGRDCDNVKFIREVPASEVSSMYPADRHRFKLEIDADGNPKMPVFHEEIGIVVINPKGVSKLYTDSDPK